MKHSVILFLLTLLLLLQIGCGSSTESRYESETEEKVKEEITGTDALVFDMTPYHSTFTFDLKADLPEDSIWYGYDTTSLVLNGSDFIEKPGYRVEVISVDNLEDANNTKSELSFRVKQNIYLIFDPPFYRVRVGDFESRESAESQSFRLRQLGFPDSRVVSDTVKVPENL